jgi:CubicO group peptidase (beta-lactamase class C family)
VHRGDSTRYRETPLGIKRLLAVHAILYAPRLAFSSAALRLPSLAIQVTCNMSDIAEKLQSLRPQILEILAASGSPGLSLGVLHHGDVIHTAHLGRRDALRDSLPNDDTIYHVASLTKAITATAVACLVDDGILDWDLPIRHYLPEFGQRSDQLGQQCSLIDLLSNRTGLTMANSLWGQKQGEFLLPKNEIVRTICHLDAIKPFRESFVYSQWNYALVTEVCERITGMRFGQYVREKILDPLEMYRTSFMPQKGDNAASPHVVCNDGTPYSIALTNLSDETGFAGANAARSSIKDLLSFYRSLLSAHKHQTENISDFTEGSPMKQVKKILSPYVGVGTSRIEEGGYCLGLYRTLLPNNLSISSMNNLLLGPKRMPRIGSGSPGLDIYHHAGNVPGFLASAFLIPSTQSAIVVLTNALPYMDPTDFVGQLIVSVLLGSQSPGGLLGLCKAGRPASLASYTALSASLEKHKTSRPPSFPKIAYVGEYINTAGNFVLSITMSELGLTMLVQHMPLTRYSLLPYDGDTFYWPADRDAELIQCMWPIISTGWHKVTFKPTERGEIDRLIWKHDPFARAEVFHKRSSDAGIQREKL